MSCMALEFGLTPRCAAVWLALAAAAASAQTSNDDLAAKASDPTASLMSFQLYDWSSPSLRGVDGSQNQVVFRAAIPFVLFGSDNIFRVTQPYVSSSPAGRRGFGDTQVFNLTVFGTDWGRWGLGLSGSLPTGGDGLTADKWTLGPALGFVDSSTKGINWGLFTQTFFSIAGKADAPAVGILNLQPIFSYQLGGGRSLSLGNSALVYDTRQSRWQSLAAGLNYGQVLSLWGQKWRPNAEIDHDFQDRLGNPRWTFRVGVALLLPTL